MRHLSRKEAVRYWLAGMTVAYFLMPVVFSLTLSPSETINILVLLWSFPAYYAGLVIVLLLGLLAISTVISLNQMAERNSAPPKTSPYVRPASEVVEDSARVSERKEADQEDHSNR
jgi:hypothetical protein